MSKIIIPAEQLNQIISDYKNGMTISDLSRKYPYRYAIIDNYLIQIGVKQRKHSKLSQDKIQSIIDMINNGYGLTDIKTTLRIDTSTIRNIANEYGTTIERQYPPRTESNKDFKDDYFSVINTEAKAYYLGLIYTDGYVRVHNNRYFTAISLQYGDKYIIEKFKEELCCGNNIYISEKVTNYSNGKPSKIARFESCNSKKMFDDLGKFNIIPNKSYDSKTFTNVEAIPKELYKHFIRGLIDGDGTIWHSGREYGIQIVDASEQFCVDFNELLQNSLKQELHYDIRQLHEHVWMVRYRRKEEVKDIIRFLYDDSSIMLKRKYTKAIEILNS